MVPSLRQGQIVLALRHLPIKRGDIVVARVGRREVIKRVATITRDSVELLGDNLDASTDSREYGSVDRSSLFGKVVLTY